MAYIEKIDEAVLQQMLRCNESGAWQLLYERYAHLVYGFLYQSVNDKEEAGELLVKVFCRLKTGIATISFSGGIFLTLYRLSNMVLNERGIKKPVVIHGGKAALKKTA